MLRSHTDGNFVMNKFTLRKLVDCEAGAELWLEPGGLRRHDIARIRDVHKLLH